MITIDDIKRKGIWSEIVERLSKAEKDVRVLQARAEDDFLPVLTYISELPSMGGIEDDLKRKGIISEIVRRLTKVEEDIRKLQSRG